ncbi:MAG: MFS transporter [Candidatus Doudnabacteria bacterium]|nr:MFS transporter [Candidatus Doudnabacteria bacterium]
MLLHFRFPQYFSKKIKEEISEVYAHASVANLAMSMMALFEPIFLYAVLGFTINQVMLFTALVYGTYIIFIPLGGKVASFYGYKHAIAFSVPFQILYWMVLIASQNDHSIAFIGALLYGLSKTFYWPGFHSLMARYADRDQVGREFGVVYSLISLTHIAGPLFAGFMSQRFGFTITFIITSVIYTLSLVPLFRAREIFTPKVYEYSQTWEMYKSYPKKFLGYLGFGEEMLALNIWPIFIYIIVKDFERAGALATVASLLAAVLALIIGKVTDQYSKRVLIRIGAFFGSIVWVMRFMAVSFWSTFFLDSLGRTSKELAFIPLSTVTYIRAENTHVVPYIVFFEQSLAVGKFLACLLGIIVFGLTGSFMALFILAGLFTLLYMFI